MEFEKIGKKIRNTILPKFYTPNEAMSKDYLYETYVDLYENVIPAIVDFKKGASQAGGVKEEQEEQEGKKEKVPTMEEQEPTTKQTGEKSYGNEKDDYFTSLLIPFSDIKKNKDVENPHIGNEVIGMMYSVGVKFNEEKNFSYKLFNTIANVYYRAIQAIKTFNKDKKNNKNKITYFRITLLSAGKYRPKDYDYIFYHNLILSVLKGLTYNNENFPTDLTTILVNIQGKLDVVKLFYVNLIKKDYNIAEDVNKLTNITNNIFVNDKLLTSPYSLNESCAIYEKDIYNLNIIKKNVPEKLKQYGIKDYGSGGDCMFLSVEYGLKNTNNYNLDCKKLRKLFAHYIYNFTSMKIVNKKDLEMALIFANSFGETFVIPTEEKDLEGISKIIYNCFNIIFPQIYSKNFKNINENSIQYIFINNFKEINKRLHEKLDNKKNEYNFNINDLNYGNSQEKIFITIIFKYYAYLFANPQDEWGDQLTLEFLSYKLQINILYFSKTQEKTLIIPDKKNNEYVHTNSIILYYKDGNHYQILVDKNNNNNGFFDKINTTKLEKNIGKWLSAKNKDNIEKDDKKEKEEQTGGAIENLSPHISEEISSEISGEIESFMSPILNNWKLFDMVGGADPDPHNLDIVFEYDKNNYHNMFTSNEDCKGNIVTQNAGSINKKLYYKVGGSGVNDKFETVLKNSGYDISQINELIKKKYINNFDSDSKDIFTEAEQKNKYTTLNLDIDVEVKDPTKFVEIKTKPEKETEETEETTKITETTKTMEEYKKFNRNFGSLSQEDKVKKLNNDGWNEVITEISTPFEMDTFITAASNTVTDNKNNFIKDIIDIYLQSIGIFITEYSKDLDKEKINKLEDLKICFEKFKDNNSPNECKKYKKINKSTVSPLIVKINSYFQTAKELFQESSPNKDKIKRIFKFIVSIPNSFIKQFSYLANPNVKKKPEELKEEKEEIREESEEPEKPKKFEESKKSEKSEEPEEQSEQFEEPEKQPEKSEKKLKNADIYTFNGWINALNNMNSNTKVNTFDRYITSLWTLFNKYNSTNFFIEKNNIFKILYNKIKEYKENKNKNKNKKKIRIKILNFIKKNKNSLLIPTGT